MDGDRPAHHAGDPAPHGARDRPGHPGVELDVLGIGYHAVTEEQREAVVAAHPRPDFKNQILAAFTEGIKNRPETTFGNVKADVLAHFVPGFVQGDFVEVIKNSAWPAIGPAVSRRVLDRTRDRSGTGGGGRRTRRPPGPSPNGSTVLEIGPDELGDHAGELLGLFEMAHVTAVLQHCQPGAGDDPVGEACPARAAEEVVHTGDDQRGDHERGAVPRARRTARAPRRASGRSTR